MSVAIRTIRTDEWPLWRDLRLRALADSPDAFRATLAEESAKPDEWWIELIGKTVEHPRGGLWIAWVGGEAGGMLFGRIDRDWTTLEVGAMWVAPELRRNGIGSDLIQACVEWGRRCGASTASLWATVDNREAVAFYERHGFLPTEAREVLRPGSNLVVRRFERAI